MKHAYIDKGSRKIVTLFAKKSGYFSPKIGGGKSVKILFRLFLEKNFFAASLLLDTYKVIYLFALKVKINYKT